MLYSCELKYGIFSRKRLRFNFDMLAWFIIYNDFGWDFEAIEKADKAELMTKMLYAAAKSAALSKGESFKMTAPKIARILGKSRTVESDKLKEVFARSAAAIPAELQAKVSGKSEKKKPGMMS